MLAVTSRPIPDSDPPLVVVVFHDVTADRRERDELASFAGVVAHDLLNPLTVVEGWSEALLEAARAGVVVPPERQADQLERIQRAAQRMKHLIGDLLAYTTARDLKITPVRCDLRALAQDIVRARVDASRVRDEPSPVITVGDLPDVLAEPVLLRQVVDNLIGNSVKYVAPGVRPEIEVSGQVLDDGMVHVEVSDNGIGIPDGQHESVFDTFHRAHQDGYRGTGLGLSIVKRIVERHGGTATARDNDQRERDHDGGLVPSGRPRLIASGPYLARLAAWHPSKLSAPARSSTPAATPPSRSRCSSTTARSRGRWCPAAPPPARSRRSSCATAVTATAARASRRPSPR